MNNIKKLFSVLLLCTSLIALAQGDTTNAINWTSNLSWQQIKEKAKKENKYIFVDCYATWCKPCKAMDKEVYTVDSVGDYLNAGFISVKVQMDQTKNDDAFVKSWYKTAKDLGSKYRIAVYPSYVFFAPNGDVVSKETGYKDPGSFILAARNAKDPSKQYFILLKKYKQGKLDHAMTVSLIKMAKDIEDTSDYRKLLNSYYSNLRLQGKEKLYTKEKIEFIGSTINRSSQVLFSMFYPDGSAVDKVMEKNGYAKNVVDQVILKEKINPFLLEFEGKPEPDWNVLYQAIAKEYKGDYADRNVMEAKMKWYNFYGPYLKFATTLNDKMEKYGSDTTSIGEDFRLNTLASIMFENIENVVELKRIIGWMAGVVRRREKATGEYIKYGPCYIDTYANLLYKVGETLEAVKWQVLAVTKGKELGSPLLQAMEKNLEKMKKGEPTWFVPKQNKSL